MFSVVRRALLSWVDANRVVLDYVEQMAEKGFEETGGGKRPLDSLMDRMQENKRHLKETMRGLAINTFHNGLEQIDDKLDELNRRISVLEKAKVKTKKTASHTETKIHKSRPRKHKIPKTDDEPIVDG
jgi:septation ring formation regulator EzrA